MPELILEQFASELDAATQAHMEWSRRMLRCAVLRISPGDDALSDKAHTLCHFGCWFTQHRANFEVLDAERTLAMATRHQDMHDAARNICKRVLEGQPGQASDLDKFESAQRQLIDHLAYFKTLIVSQYSQIDALTGLPLRHRMNQDFDLLNKHIRRRGSLQMVMMLDIDHFKSINDQHGHPGGDTVLQHLAVTLKQTLRTDDLVYRYGGEEFLLLMELKAEEQALMAAVEHAAQRVLDAIRAMCVVLPDASTVRPTATIGVALTAPEESLSSVIQRADMALYKGKATGRNRYVLAESPETLA